MAARRTQQSTVVETFLNKYGPNLLAIFVAGALWYSTVNSKLVTMEVKIDYVVKQLENQKELPQQVAANIVANQRQDQELSAIREWAESLRDRFQAHASNDRIHHRAGEADAR